MRILFLAVTFLGWTLLLQGGFGHHYAIPASVAKCVIGHWRNQR
jgi:hypothetical protein